MSHNGKLTNSTGWNAIFSWIKYALTGKRDNAQAVQDTEVSAESLVDLNARIEALESALTSLGVEADKVDYKIVQKAVANPSIPSSGTTTATSFISAITQDENGEIVPERRNLPAASASVSGITKVYTSTGGSTDGTMTRQAITNALAGKSDTGHTHDGRYYTETEVDTFLAAKAEQVNVTNYTSFSDIGAVVSAGNIPYYYHAVGSGAAKLYYQGTNVSGGIPPTVFQVFAGVFNGVLYETRFVNGASAFSAVVETPIFSAERVASSSESSSWSSDDTNVPTRAAVDAKISSAMSGDIGGFLGTFAVAYMNWWISSSRPPLTFKKGDWFSVLDSGTINYKVNNTGADESLAVNAYDDVYWTTDGHLKQKVNNGMHVYPVSELEDWDTLTATGVYTIASQASNVAHGPGGGSGGRIVCYVAVTNGRIIQLAIAGRLWRRQSDNNGGFSNASWEEIAFSSQVYSYVAKTGIYSESSNPFALKDYVDALSTNIPKSRLDQNVQNSLTRADNALTGDPLGISNGSGVVSSYRGAIVFILFASGDFVSHTSNNGPMIPSATVGGKLCINVKWLVDYKINVNDRKNHQVYAVLNASGSDFVLTKGVDSSSAGTADHVLVENEKIAFFGCYGGSSTLQVSDYYLMN